MAFTFILMAAWGGLNTSNPMIESYMAVTLLFRVIWHFCATSIDVVKIFAVIKSNVIKTAYCILNISEWQKANQKC